MDDQLFSVWSEQPSQTFRIDRTECLRIDEIWNDLDLFCNAVIIHRLIAQILRDGGDAIGCFDRKFHQRLETRFETDERYVRAVQRGDNLDVAFERWFVVLHDLFGEDRARGMRD